MEYEYVDTDQIDIEDTKILELGEPKISSPFALSDLVNRDARFVPEAKRVLIEIDPDKIMKLLKEGKQPASFEIAGPRKKIYFDPSKLRCAIVTCGGLCPGLNDIIRAIVLELYYGYGVNKVYGIKYGLQGFIPSYRYSFVDLSPKTVVSIHERGGTILGSSRGEQDIDEIIDCLERESIGIVFMIGGDGTIKAASKIADSILAKGLKISVVAIPKTIDNDIYLVSKSFGFDTAVDIATKAITAAHNEAEGYPNGVGLIKLMGRDSGFIAATAALSQMDVNFVLIPEVDFDLEGPNGFLATLEQRLNHRKHAVIIVAEGAGQKFFEGAREKDPSGNIKHHDIGLFLKDKINSYFKGKGMELNLKYIDPSYMVRSLPANANDHVFCGFLGRDAVHAGIAGKTKLLIGYCNEQVVHVPLELSAGKRKIISPNSKLWHSVLEATGQVLMKN
ncbi:MAG: ATP-dependent 6-phosphofructokinase [Desulfobacterales bacterium]|nr:ATP-dependent 6-phosphofructokinase [Desulfobacterales bacterium]